MESIDIHPQALRDVATTVLKAGGSSADEARIVADHLVLANLSGHDSHGVGMLPAYERSLSNGTLNPNQNVELVRDDGAIMMFDGGMGYGQVVGRQATAAAIERCRSTGVVVAPVRYCHHLGRIGTYGEQVADAGLASLHFVNVVGHQALVAPYRGTDARYSTNPICLSLPGSDEQPPVLLDMATSRIAHGKARVAHNMGEETPEGSLIDHRGRKTRDPGVLFRQPAGALTSFGDHKGYGLAVFCELLGGMMSGGRTGQPEHEMEGTIINNMFMIVFDPDRLIPRSAMDHELAALVAHVKASPAAQPHEPVLVPGDPERASRIERADAIPVDAESWRQIVAAGERLGVQAGRLEAVASAPPR